MKKLNVTFKSEEDKIEFVNKCERDFENRLIQATQKIVKSDVNCVLLSGPTCSGKTTTAKKLIDDFTDIGKKVVVISIDDFFKERDDGRVVINDKKIDYDSVDVLDIELLSKCIKSAYVGNTISVPTFNFVTQKRGEEKYHFIDENTVLLFEGIQAVYPEVTSLFEVEYKGIFINVNEDVCLNDVYFSKNEIRLIRRLVRDRKFRGATADFTLYLWETVRENEEKSIYPNSSVCEVQLDSFMCYELFLMKEYITEVLQEVDVGSPYYNEANELLNKFASLEQINYEYIPNDSLYEEFLGKK